MRAGQLSAAVVLVALLGFLGLRIASLEQRVSALAARVPARARAVPAPAARSGSAPVLTERWSDAYDQHLASLEARAGLLDEAPTLSAGPPASDAQILKVVEREHSRIREGLLDFHKKHWLEQRMSGLDAFAKANGLSGQQKSALEGALKRELDALVELLRRPAAIDDPGSVQRDWRATIDASDAAIGSFL